MWNREQRTVCETVQKHLNSRMSKNGLTTEPIYKKAYKQSDNNVTITIKSTIVLKHYQLAFTLIAMATFKGKML